MLDLVISHHGKCSNCGQETECARVWFWDRSFGGSICWPDLLEIVRKLSMDPECRKKFSQGRSERESHSRDSIMGQYGRTHTICEGETYIGSIGESTTKRRSESTTKRS